jgi:formylglycine-generating enzyme required for sulfatase activity
VRRSYKRIAVSGLVVVLAAGYWMYQRFGTASIQVSTAPTGAVVRLDGQRLGESPLVVTVDAGRHLLVIEHSYFATLEESISLSRGDHLTRHFDLSVSEGTLSLLSNPQGAWVEVDGKRLPRQTPTVLTTSAGKKIVRMGLPERFPVEQEVMLASGARVEVNLNLNIDPHGSLTVAARPRGATIELPLTDIKYEPGVRVPIGEHLIRVSHTGYNPREIRYKVRYGDNLTQINLERLFGKLIVRVQPDEAEIQVSYLLEGTHRLRSVYREAMSVPVGPVEVRARAIGHRTAFANFHLGERGYTVRLRLSPMVVVTGERFRDRLKSGGDSPEMIVIPAGTFTMGDANGFVSEQPEREISLTQPFALSVNEVTIAEFEKYLRAQMVELSYRLSEAPKSEPVRYITWEEAQDYVDWLSEQTGEKYRLPSEAEWEYAARAGTRGSYFFGEDALQLCEFANVADRSAREIFLLWDIVACTDGYRKIAPVGMLAANPFGLYDIYGNVSEWVAECGMPTYESAPTDGSVAEGYNCDTHGHRGGSWDSQAAEMRSANRNNGHGAGDDRGIRLLREL